MTCRNSIPILFSLLVLSLSVLFIGCGGGGGSGGDSDKGTSNTISIGPNGGRIEFPNGVILDIPEGAITKETKITITDLQPEEVDVILSNPPNQIYKKSFVGGFSAEPSGLQFNTPIKAIIPIMPIEPDEIPMQMEIDFNGDKYWISKTNLTYSPDTMTAEIEVSHFSDIIVGALQGIDPAKLNEFCTDPFWNPLLSICEDYDDLQPKECLLPFEERPEDIICCREKTYDVKAQASDFAINKTNGECEILFDSVEVTYRDCKKNGQSVGPQTHSIGEISPYCPEDLVLEINVQPSTVNMFVCDKEPLTATIKGLKPDGDIIFEETTFQPVWESDDPKIADVDPDGAVVGLSEGDVLIKALAGNSKNIIPGEVLVNVRSNIRSFSVTPSQVVLKTGEEQMLTAELVDAFDNLLDASDVTWSSEDPTKADVILNTGPVTWVVGENKGSTTIVAEYQYDCEVIQARINVTVDCAPVSFTIAPDMVSMVEGGVEMLQATILDENQSALDAAAVTWVSANSDIVNVTIPEGEFTSISGIRKCPLPIRITGSYSDGCQTLEAFAFANVEELSVVLESNFVIIDEGAAVSVGVKLDNPPPLDKFISIYAQRASGDSSISVTSQQPLFFDNSNWDTYQQIDIAANEDMDVCNGQGMINVWAYIDEPSGGSKMIEDFISVLVNDQDQLSFVTSKNSVVVPEGSTETFGVKLSHKPCSSVDVFVSFLDGDSSLAVFSGANLTFNTANWNTYQTVTLQAETDEDSVNGEANFVISSISHSIDTETITALEQEETTGTEYALEIFYESSGSGLQESCGGVVPIPIEISQGNLPILIAQGDIPAYYEDSFGSGNGVAHITVTNLDKSTLIEWCLDEWVERLNESYLFFKVEIIFDIDLSDGRHRHYLASYEIPFYPGNNYALECSGENFSHHFALLGLN